MKSDSQIQQDVELELKWDPSVTHEHIGVSVLDGVVTLSGRVIGFIEKSSAERAAERVSGVKAVVDKIEVKLPGAHIRDDQEIAKEIIQQFKWSFQIPEEQIKAKVANAWVELHGEVEWDFQRNAAVNCVRNLTGVRGVSNFINLKAKPVQAQLVRQKIQEALKRKAVQEAKQIRVEVRGNKVILEGEVYSFAEMNDAKWAAWSAPGVLSIENRLEVNHG